MARRSGRPQFWTVPGHPDGHVAAPMLTITGRRMPPCQPILVVFLERLGCLVGSLRTRRLALVTRVQGEPDVAAVHRGTRADTGPQRFLNAVAAPCPETNRYTTPPTASRPRPGTPVTPDYRAPFRLRGRHADRHGPPVRPDTQVRRPDLMRRARRSALVERPASARHGAGRWRWWRRRGCRRAAARPGPAAGSARRTRTHPSRAAG